MIHYTFTTYYDIGLNYWHEAINQVYMYSFDNNDLEIVLLELVVKKTKVTLQCKYSLFQSVAHMTFS